MSTISERAERSRKSGRGHECMVFVSAEKDELLVWNAFGMLKRLSFNRRPLSVIRQQQRKNFVVNYEAGTVRWPEAGVEILSPFKHIHTCAEAHPGMSHMQFLYKEKT